MCAAHQVRKVSLRLASSPRSGRTAPGRAGCARPRPAALPARSAGRQPRLPRSDRRLPPRPRAQLGIGAPDAVLVLFHDVRHMDYADPCRFSDTRSTAHTERTRAQVGGTTMAQDPRQPDGLVHRSRQTSEQFGGPHATATYPPRAAFAAGQPQGCQVTLTVPGPPGGGRCGTALGIPATAGDGPGSCCQFKRDIEQHVRPGCACMGP